MKPGQIPENGSLRDPGTHAYSAAFMADCFDRESCKAGRYRRPFSLIFLAIENRASLVEQTRENIVDTALSEMIGAIMKKVRGSDIVGRVSSDRFCILLAETDGFGSTNTLRRLRRSAHETGKFLYLGKEFALAPCLVSVTYPRDGEDFGELSRVGEEKCLRQRNGPLHRLRLMDKPLWEAFDILVDRNAHENIRNRRDDILHAGHAGKDLGRNGCFSLDRAIYSRLVEAVAQDASSLGDSRGIVIAAGPRPEIFRRIFLSFGSEASARCRICIIGKAGGARFNAKNLAFVDADDEYLKEREVLLYLKENGAYGVFAAGRDDEMCGFNTADEWLVDSMMDKLQGAYFPRGY
jgi:diguanylate cyclase (GGDEF)-like protein